MQVKVIEFVLLQHVSHIVYIIYQLHHMHMSVTLLHRQGLGAV